MDTSFCFCFFVCAASGLHSHTPPEGYSDRWTFIFNVLISVFAQQLEARVCVCVLTSRPLNKVSVGVRRQSVPGMHLSAALWGALWDCGG